MLEVYPLNSEEVAFLLAQIPARQFNVEEALIYAGQVPLAGYVLLEGKITIEKRGSPPRDIPVNSLICVRELLNDMPIRQTVKIASGSKAIILDKSTVLEIMENKKGLFLTA